MSRILTTAQRFRRELLARDAQAAADMLDAYRPAHEAIKAQLASIQAKIEDAQMAGKPLGRSWLFQEGRAKALEQQIQQAMAGFAPRANEIVQANQRDAVAMGMANSRDMAAAVSGRRAPVVIGSWQRLPQHAIEDLVGFASNGGPLRELFDALGPQVSAAVRSELSTGLALGRNPRVVARAVNARSGMGLARALTISRTEALRSYRETNRRSFDQSGVVTGWKWLSARQVNTCAACWAMDGEVFDTNDQMEAHPNCRCTMVPVTGSEVEIGTGVDVFASLPERTQRRILGPGKHDAYKNGQIGLKDLVARRRSRDWGTSVQVASLRQALGG